MGIKAKWCKIAVHMWCGRMCRMGGAYMSTAIDVETEAGMETKWYRRELSSAEAGILMRKLEKATGTRSIIQYSTIDPRLTEKSITYYWER